MSRSGNLPPRRLRAYRSIGVVLGAAGLLVTALGASACAASSPVNETFATSSTAMQTITGGTWTVGNGRLNLTVPATAAAARPLANLSVNRNPIADSAWTYSLSATPQPIAGRAAGFSAVIAYRDASNYDDVTFSDQHSGTAAGGLFRTKNGIRTRLQAFDSPVMAGRTYQLSIRWEDGIVKVFRDGLYVSKLTIGDFPSGTKVGVGSSGDAVRFDDLLVQPRTSSGSTSGATPAPVPPAPTPAATPTPTPVPTPTPTPTPTTGSPSPSGLVVTVRTSAELTAALANALPGTVISLADGSYSAATTVGGTNASFAVTRSGSATSPITLRGSRNAVLRGTSLSRGYGLYLSGASYWNLEGLTVSGAAKGIVLDRSSHVTIAGVAVTGIGDEGIHLRSFSSDNVVRNNVVTRTGLQQPQYGEGIYVGSATSNWGTYSAGGPDRSDRNSIIGNTIRETGAESIDIKEGTTAGTVSGNTFDGTGMSGQNYADSLLDVKGNGWRIVGNTGTHSLTDGFQVHNVASGWGMDTVFSSNHLTVTKGFGISVQQSSSRTVVRCDNVVTGGSGVSNLGCTG